MRHKAALNPEFLLSILEKTGISLENTAEFR